MKAPFVVGAGACLFAAVVTASPLEKRQDKTINLETEYSTQCKTCPYEQCVNVVIERNNVTLTCWTEGDQIADTNLWLRTTDNCFVTEYDLVEYTGDFRSELPTCGNIPIDITEDDGTVKYLSECKWAAYTSDESIEYLGRDQDLVVTCWVNGDTVLTNDYWYKVDGPNCYVSETGLYDAPNRDSLQNCGPQPDPRANESQVIDTASLQMKIPRKFSRPANPTKKTQSSPPPATSQTHSKRWLQAEQIGEEYAPCLSCGNSTQSCARERTYQFNQTVVSQCVKIEDVVYPNGSFTSIFWMLTTDWCYVDSNNFWVPPYDNYRYPFCESWGY